MVAASLVCMVPMTRWPVSAALTAISIVSRSRSSPITMMSGILAQRALERREERLGVVADLALGDAAALRLLHHLDRVLDRDDVVLAGLVQVGDHRRERRRLARSRPGPVMRTRPLW